MKVLLEGSSLFFKNYTGIPHYILNLHTALSRIDEIDTTYGFRLKKRFKASSAKQKEILNNKHVWHQTNVLIPNYRPDVAHSLHTPFLNLKKALKVVTIHDLAVHLPEFGNYDFASPYFIKKRFKLFGEFAKNADVIVAVSEATKNDFLRFFDFPEERVHVVPLAPSTSRIPKDLPDTQNILDRYQLNGKGYYLFVGGISLRKNTFNLVKAYHLSESRKEFKLVISGNNQESSNTEVRDYVVQNKLEKNIVFTDYLDKSELQCLFANAKGFLFPTFYEGFGIPILEAMIHELPVLTSNTGAAPQTSGGHAILVDPHSPENIAKGIDNLYTLDNNRLEEAKKFAMGHSWDRTAKMTLELYRKYL